MAVNEEVLLDNPDTFLRSDLFSLLKDLREESPVCWQPEREYADGTRGPGFWAIMRYDDLIRVNRDPETFSNGPTTSIRDMSDEEAQQVHNMIQMDPPEHTRFRGMVNKGFTPRRVRKLEETIRERAAKIIESVRDKGGCDFVTDIAAELPLQVIADLLGVPQEERLKLFEWTNRLLGSEDPEYAVEQEEVMSAAVEMAKYASALAEERRQDPRDDLVSILVNSDPPLTAEEFNPFFLLLAVAGNETTRNAITHGMAALSDHPEQRRRLELHPELMPSAVEEMVRWATPVIHFRRTARRDTEIRGQRIRAGEKVVLFFLSANRDEEEFVEPEKFDMERSPNRHVGFGGGGPHFCLGAHLARLEIRVMFEELLKRLPDIEVVGTPERLRSGFIHGIKHMEVEFSGSSA